jgi:GNAT superfamily N-acetyltransferase
MDLAAIVDFNQRLAMESEGKTLDCDVLSRGVERALADPGRLRYFIAESVDGDRIGQLGITTEWSDWRNGWIWWIQSVYVTMAWRRCGVLRGMVEAVVAEARAEADVVGMRLYVEHRNASARSAYRALGMADGGYEVMERFWERAGTRLGGG